MARLDTVQVRRLHLVELCKIGWLIRPRPRSHVLLLDCFPPSPLAFSTDLSTCAFVDIAPTIPINIRATSFLLLKMRFFKLVFASTAFQTTVVIGSPPSCRYLPGDSEWPAAEEWNALNSTVGRRLIATTPLGSPCHDPTYNATKCAYLQSQWNDPQLQ
jgi:hypothetical protein